MAKGSFSMQIGEFIAKTKASQDLLVRSITMGISKEIDSRSPVGDAIYWKRKPPPGYAGGRFRGNWQLSLGSPATAVLDRIDKDGAATIAAHGDAMRAAKAGDVIYLVNNLPYAKRIEDGWARRAPIGVVMLTVLNFQKIVDKSVLELRGGTSESDFAQGYSTYKL
ncbi:hypothetical protein [Janthinobacterium sp. PC23-8]|uniref:hypothetical protein n=1 Tax=Janthinobacterium sp. PC23-8 TaxID=2012679 RepID=UPI000B97B61F|nr:hypothetical protein [Janthinobacterium sp. PC23-8]OYO29150.1 hypothetical protein CD932_18780 [Janthinobacterium sp. PC23-8]